jgi:hypothetical protein
MIEAFKVFFAVVLGVIFCLFGVLVLSTPFAIRYGSDLPVREWLRKKCPPSLLRRVHSVGKDDEYLCRALVRWLTFRVWLIGAAVMGVAFLSIVVLGLSGRLKD